MRSSTGRIGVWPSASTRSSSMKLANRSPILVASAPSTLPSAQPSMISRTCCSAASASITNGPQAARSLGISAVSSQEPLTCPNRSSWMRMSGFMPSRASSRIVTPAIYPRPRERRTIAPHDRDADQHLRRAGLRHRGRVLRHRRRPGAGGPGRGLRLLRGRQRRRRQLAPGQRQRDVLGLRVAAHQHLAPADVLRVVPDARLAAGLSRPPADRGVLRRLRRPLRAASSRSPSAPRSPWSGRWRRAGTP